MTARNGKMAPRSHHRIGIRIAASALALFGVAAPECPVAAQTATYNYTYDLLGRVTTAFNAAAGVCIAYSYDPNGNRTSQVITNSGAAVTPVWGSGKWGCFAWTPH